MARRAALSLAVLFLLALLVVPIASAAHSTVRVWQPRDDQYGSEGTVEVHATPAEIHAAVRDFEGWPRLFKDVKRAEVKRRTATEAIVEFESRTLGHSHTLRIQTGDANRTRFEVTDGHGIELSGEFSLEPITEGVTRIRGHLHNKATGFFGWFVSDASVREKRETKLRHDLQDLHTRFGRAR